MAALTTPPSPETGGPAAWRLFFEHRLRSLLCAADRQVSRCHGATSHSHGPADWLSILARAFAASGRRGFRPCVPASTSSDAKSRGPRAVTPHRSRRTLLRHLSGSGFSACIRRETGAVLHELRPQDPGATLRAGTHYRP